MEVIRKDATITNTDEEFPGSFEVILSAPTKDRDGETLLPEEWKQPLPDHITFDSDHGMTVATTVGSGVPRIDEATGNLVVAGRYSSLPRAQEVRTLVNEDHIRTTSVAFMSEKTEKDGKSVATRELLNGAFVAIPSNREALVLSSKGIKAGARNSASDLAAIQEIHDLVTALGADCAGMAKSVGTVTVDVTSAIKACEPKELVKLLQAATSEKSVAGSLEATQDRVRDALNDVYGTEAWVWLRATIPSGDGGSCIFEIDSNDGSDSDCYQQSYTDDGSVVTLTGDRTPVDLMEVIKPDPDEDGSSEPAPASAAAPAKAAAPAETKAADDDELQTRVRALDMSVSTYAD
jgi:hypothetical protein